MESCRGVQLRQIQLLSWGVGGIGWEDQAMINAQRHAVVQFYYFRPEMLGLADWSAPGQVLLN